MMTRVDSIKEGAAIWGSFYRSNPDKFCEDYLHLHLRKFQRVLITMMFWSTTFVLIACRGIGKTFLSAIYCVVRCILYPGTVVCIASKTRGQACTVLEKILYELRPRSDELRNEIDEKETKTNGTNAQIVFKNTSRIKVVTAGDSARSNRCHVLLLDEFRLVRKDTVDTILKKFLTLKRMPEYSALSDAEKSEEYRKEKNLTLFLSSAYFKDNWSYTKCTDTLKAMVSGKRQFVCGFPYQLSILEGLLDPELVADEMAESDFSEIKFLMEMGAEFYGSAEGAFFDFDTISKNRHIIYPMLPDKISSKLSNPKPVRIPPKKNGELRLMSADIALMSSKKHNNDATAVFINQLMPTKAKRYTSNIVYADSFEGLRTDDQALVLRRLFDEFQCDYLVIDTIGVGLGVADILMRDISDPDTGEVYPAITCVNDKAMAERCTVQGAEKKLWSIKANAAFNSDAAFLLREAFKSGRIRLLVNEYDSEEALSDLSGYASLNPPERLLFQLPYVHTTLLIDELVNLQHEEYGGKIRIYEKPNMRKDRYSSLSYNYYVATQLENKLTKKQNLEAEIAEAFIIKPPSNFGKAVRNKIGESKKTGWR